MLGVLAASGCSGGSGDVAATTRATSAAALTTAASPTSTPSAPATSTTSSTPASASSSKGTAAGAPGVPEPARQHTKAGARAFAEYFYSVINAKYRDPKKGTVKEISTSGCSFCDTINKDLESMMAKGQRYDRDQFKYRTTKTDRLGNQFSLVHITMQQQPARLLSRDGTVLETTPTPTVKSVVHVEWLKGKGWRVAEVQHE
nr:DUF6318 family protein [Flexivirga oryzae]